MEVSGDAVDVLRQPTRARLFALLTELRRSATTDELATEVGLHPNGVRAHLERLEDARLVTRERQRHGRGRPRDSWSVSRIAQPGGEPPTAYVDLARWLARAMAESGGRARDVRKSGRRIGRELAPSTLDASPEERMHGVLVAMGFQPLRRFDSGGTLTYCLENCPYRAAVDQDQPLVCDLHRGLTRGLLDEIAPTTKLAAFVPKDPETAGCEISLRGPLVDEAARRAPD